MRILAFFFIAMFLSAPAFACEIGAPYDWESTLPCSAKAKKLMERMGSCMHFGGEEPYDKERAAFLNKNMRELGCMRLACDYHALTRKADRTVVTAYIKVYYGSVKDFDKAQQYPRSCQRK